MKISKAIKIVAKKIPLICGNLVPNDFMSSHYINQNPTECKKSTFSTILQQVYRYQSAYHVLSTISTCRPI